MNYEKEFLNMPTLQKQRMVAYGELMNPETGNKLSNASVDAYNRYTQDFNESNWRPTQEKILDNRNKFLKQC